MPADDGPKAPAWIRRIIDQSKAHEGHVVVQILHPNTGPSRRENYPSPWHEKACLSCGEIVHPIQEV